MPRAQVHPGTRFRVVLPYSEASMHLKVAGHTMTVELTARTHPMAQLYQDDGRLFSFPLTCGEAGITRVGADYFADVVEEPLEPALAVSEADIAEELNRYPFCLRHDPYNLRWWQDMTEHQQRATAITSLLVLANS